MPERYAKLVVKSNISAYQSGESNEWICDFLEESRQYARFVRQGPAYEIFRLICDEGRESPDFAVSVPIHSIRKPANFRGESFDSTSRAIYSAFALIELDGRTGSVSAWEERGPRTCKNMLSYYHPTLSLFSADGSIEKAKRYIYDVSALLASKRVTAITQKEVNLALDCLIRNAKYPSEEPLILEEASLLWAAAEVSCLDTSIFFKTHPDSAEDIFRRSAKESGRWLIGQDLERVVNNYRAVYPYIRGVQDPNLFDLMEELQRLETVKLLESMK